MSAVARIDRRPPRSVRIPIPLLLPDAPGLRDPCVDRLQALLADHDGIERVHSVDDGEGGADLCLHYDPEVATLADVERLARAAGAKISERFRHDVLVLHAIDGEDAARRIEADLESVAGVMEASVNLPAQRVRIEYDREWISLDDVLAALRALGYRADRSGAAKPPGVEPWIRRNKELALSLGAGAMLAAAWAGSRWLALPQAVVVPLYLASYSLGAWDLVRHWVAHLRKGRVAFDIDLLMLLAAIGAATLGEWSEGAFLLFLFSLAHALEHYALGRARNAIRGLAELAPARARVVRGSGTVEIPVEEVTKGESVLVRPGERIPVDGIVREGRSAVNQAPITGESVPVEKDAGNEVFAGTVNGDGSLKVEVTRAAGDRTLDRVVQLVEQAQTQKAPTQRFTDRFESIFVPAVLVFDVLLIAIPPLAGFWSWSTSFYRGMALLVAASPCALALGTPAAVLAGIAQAARKGVLIKGGVHLENLGVVRALALDKTGTLTRGEPSVTDVIPAAGVEAEELLRTAAAVERLSQHPLAQAVVRRAEKDGLELPETGPLESIMARGVRAEVAGRSVAIGNLRLWEDAGEPVPQEIRSSLGRLEEGGASVMAVKGGERWLGVIGLADRPRDGAREVLARLHALGIERVVMLTGDNQGVAERIAAELGVDDVRAGLLPEDKVTAIKELAGSGKGVAMVGDGVNDAPALAHATVGIAMGGAGSAVALETADVALMADDLAGLPFAVGLSREARSVIRQNLVVSLTVIAVLVFATATGLTGIGLAVLVHEGSTLIVVANALRLLQYAA